MLRLPANKAGAKRRCTPSSASKASAALSCFALPAKDSSRACTRVMRDLHFRSSMESWARQHHPSAASTLCILELALRESSVAGTPQVQDA